jgi:copper chaperone CopZ
MKTKILSFVALFMFLNFTVPNEKKMEKFDVKGGNCDECQNHIEKAALTVEGVFMSHWNSETKELQVIFDDSKTKLDAVEKAVAKAGNDTPNYKATDEDYNKLPECCKYERN